MPTWSSSRSAPARARPPRAARSLLPPPATTESSSRQEGEEERRDATAAATTTTTRESQRDGFCHPVGMKEATGRAKGGTAISSQAADLDPRLAPRTRRRPRDGTRSPLGLTAKSLTHRHRSPPPQQPTRGSRRASEKHRQVKKRPKTGEAASRAGRSTNGAATGSAAILSPCSPLQAPVGER